MRETTQAQVIQEHLERGLPITALDALNLYGCFRLAARIRELRKAGMNIASRPVKTNGGAIISEYRLIKNVGPF